MSREAKPHAVRFYPRGDVNWLIPTPQAFAPVVSLLGSKVQKRAFALYSPYIASKNVGSSKSLRTYLR
ncbi:hypothetical protein A2673_04065 [Candidatus Kaiserbacteria bacterium RIFCSPHIGHO2_01_FULL_50_13]|nr:MAG: hypothetical protein A2673_04065 [Candidatus Kaiserbacteria bacterium RIFCSPHIGHO2_01_FULL_50_13]